MSSGFAWRMLRVMAVGVALLVSSLIAAHLTADEAVAKAAKKSKSSSCEGRDLLEAIVAKHPAAAEKLKPTPSEARNDEALLFEVTKDDAPDAPPSYLFATVHLSDPRVTTLSDTVSKALKSSKILALEVAELSPQATAQAISEARDLVLLDESKSLDTLVSDAEFKVIVDRLEYSDTPAHLAKRFKPWVISMIMAVSKCERRNTTKGALVLDLKLADIARKSGIAVVGLESIEDQLKASAEVPLNAQIRLLRASIANADRADDLMETALQLYKKRKLSYAVPLQAFLAERAGIDGGTLRTFRRELVEKRNRKLAERMTKLLEDGGVFVAIGGIHVPGENGLVALLRRAGYTVLAIE